MFHQDLPYQWDLLCHFGALADLKPTTLLMGLSSESDEGNEKKQKNPQQKQPLYLIEVRVLSGRESKAALLGLEGQEAGQETLGNLQVVPVEAAGCLCDVAELVGQFLLHDGVEFRLVALERIKLSIQEMPKKEVNWKR